MSAVAWLIGPALASALLLPAWAGQPAVGGRIYICTDASGKRLTSDRPIPECQDREQRLLGPDGSVRASLAPPPTLAERAAKEAREREAAAEQAARLEALRVDRFLLNRYPDEATHRRTREKALDAVRESGQLSKKRMAELAAERKAALSEAEFYKSATMPPKLRGQIDANAAATESQRMLIAGQESEGARIQARFDTELERLRQLWAGVPPGSLGPLPAPAVAPGAPAK